MSRPLYRQSLPKRVSAVKGDLGKMRRARPTGQWHIPVEVADPANPNFPVLKNGWTQPANPKLKHMFRWHMDGSFQTRGHLKSTGSSGTVAYTLPGAIEGAPDFRPDKDFTFLNDVVSSAGAYLAARYKVEASSGDVSVSLLSFGLPYAGIQFTNLVSPFVAVSGTAYTFADLPDFNDGVNTDTSVFTTDLPNGRISIGDGVYITTVTVQYDLTVNNVKGVGIDWPGTRFASSGSSGEWEGAGSIFSYTEHRYVQSEGGWLTGFFDHTHGSNRDLVRAALEVTRLVDQATLDAATQLP